MQGKLVEQRAEEGTGEGLYWQIQIEKEKLIRAGKIKEEKRLPEISEDEMLFDIPKNWKWVRLSEVVDVRDGTHDSPRYYETGIPLVTSKNISSGGLNFDNVKYISKEDAKKINERSNVDTGDILFAMIGSIGNPVIVNKDRDFCVKNVALFKIFSKDKLSVGYLYWFLFLEQFVMKKIASGGVQSFISLKVFRNYLFPLPPYEEQKRIVAELEKIMSYCQRFG
ncbi:MAG: restriction endonuclease subunit S [Eubacterium sp.]|nr:restriction endonuclease subunit S [Eubacterium sp.]